MYQLEKPYQFQIEDWVVVFSDELRSKTGVQIGQVTQIGGEDIHIRFYEWQEKNFMPSGLTLSSSADEGEYDGVYLLPDEMKPLFDLAE